MIELKSTEELLKGIPTFNNDGGIGIGYVKELIKEAQRNAVEYALIQASENAVADVTFDGRIANSQEFFENPMLEGEDYEVYVINSSILNLKDKIFKENNL